MEQVGCLSTLMAFFVVMGSLFSGSYLGTSKAPDRFETTGAHETAPPRLTESILRLSPSPEILEDRARGLGEPLTKELAELLLAESVDVLRLRFPDAEVSLEEVGPRSVRQIVIHTTLERTDEQLSDLATSSGDFRLQIKASAEDAKRLECDLDGELEKAQTWLNADGARSATQYNRVAPENGGPAAGLRMALLPGEHGADPAATQKLVAVAVEVDPEWRFERDDIQRFWVSSDRNSKPAVGFDVAKDRQEAFGAFTGAHVGEQLAIIMDDRVLTTPTLNGALGGGGIITGGGNGFEEGEVERLVTLLSAPRLPMPLALHSIERR